MMLDGEDLAKLGARVGDHTDHALPHPKGGLITIDGVPITRNAVLARIGGRCCLCAQPAIVLGMFMPHDHTRKRFVANTIEAGAPSVRPGKDRNAFYGLCQTCFALPDRTVRVEELFLGRRQVDIEK